MAEEGILLYYKFVTIPDPEATRDWFASSCSSLSLLGRVRIAPGGINVTVGGSMESLRSHMDAVESQELLRGCDFKLARCWEPVNRGVAATCGFDSLSVRTVEEIVTLGVHPSPSIANAGKHLSPQEFHEILENTENVSGEKKDGIVMLDARNIYETRIGKFCPPLGVDFLDPKIRQYSDLPAWIDEHADRLRNKSVLMYCTGGVRCELASSYIRSKGDEFHNVFQLSGGIQRYLEAFPGGGYFQGKNFVFDHRISVPSKQDEIVGRCFSCRSPYDDYTSRSRCCLCRMLVLVCEKCKASKNYVCELCADNQHPDQLVEPQKRELRCNAASKLRILCLHGFRQNASNLKGRLASLSKKLKRTADFVFIDAPHELPLLYQVHEDKEEQEIPVLPHKKFAWLIDPDAPKATSETWTPVQTSFDPMQYQKQTAGWNESWSFLQKSFKELGPFDGVLGFSQGAAVATILSSLRDAGHINFKFAILCSGFFPAAVLERESGALIDCPSLHIFGGKAGCDRQIACLESEALADKFSPETRRIVRHGSGHIIPTRPEYTEQYLDFLKQFL